MPSSSVPFLRGHYPDQVHTGLFSARTHCASKHPENDAYYTIFGRPSRTRHRIHISLASTPGVARAAVAELERELKKPKANGGKASEDETKLAKEAVDEIKHSKYALGKNPENLTKNQQERLALIQADDPKLKRGHDMKEKLWLIFKPSDPELAETALDKWLAHAQRCRIPAFVELGRKVRRHKDHELTHRIRRAVAAFVQSHEHVKSFHAVYLEPESNRIYCDLIVTYALRDWETLRADFLAHMQKHFPAYGVELTIETEFV